MSEDVVEFGSSTRPREPRPSRLNVRLPQLPVPVSWVLAFAAAAAAVASFLGNWQVAELKIDREAQNFPVNQLSYAAGSTEYGIFYMFALLSVTICLVLTLRGLPVVRHTARLAGLASAVFLAAIVALRSYSFSNNPYSLIDYPLPLGEQPTYTTKLEWSIYAAYAAAFLAISALLPQPTVAAEHDEPMRTAKPIDIEFDEADDLTVIAEPTPAVSPSHELYMRK